MAVRLVNLHRQPLRVDLRGGAFVLLAPGQRSVALREELLYDNDHVPEWERAGWLRRLPARMSDVSADEEAAAQAVPPQAPEPEAAATGMARAARERKGGRAPRPARPARPRGGGR